MTQQRTESFVPLTAAPVATPQQREFRVKVIPQATGSPPFEKLPQPPATDCARARRSCEPQVSVQREGERVTSIRIQCSCGEILDLACLYAEPAKPA